MAFSMPSDCYHHDRMAEVPLDFKRKVTVDFFGPIRVRYMVLSNAFNLNQMFMISPPLSPQVS